jgi:hypothetical protein
MGGRHLVWVLTALAAGGCGVSSSLKRPADFGSVVRPQPATVALAPISDRVACDDEAYYLQDYIEERGLFYDCLLADPDRPGRYHDGDVVIGGRIEPVLEPRQGMGWGTFASVITLGVYYFLGGPTSRQAHTVTYAFDVAYTDRGVTNLITFVDRREATYGWSGPPPGLTAKREIYGAGWDRLMYEVCRDLAEHRAGGE